MSPSVAASLMRGIQLGAIFAMALYGVTCMQAFIYYKNYPQDRWGLKLTVAIIWILETIHAALVIATLDHYLIANFSEVGVMLAIDWTIFMTFIIGFFIVFLVNLYYTWRIGMLYKGRYIIIVLIVLAVVRLGLSLVCCAYTRIYKDSWLSWGQETKIIICFSLALAILTDTVITTTLVFLLRKARPTSHLHRTKRVVDGLLLYAISVGTLTIVVSFLELVVFLLAPGTLYVLGILLIQMKLYANCFLASLNIRHYQASHLAPHPLQSQFTGSDEPHGSPARTIKIAVLSGGQVNEAGKVSRNVVESSMLH
ncbi:hypothetical protein SERLA73DRAFT_189609 [Serpula lacrymans var. lacrymans S7.3]|uniref:DUF6534 domain-containing protein n=2 Tax=Serpula lacrymans var. lacrymans TaxID=341189 RepID=F8QE49_SERL3|nr:uncharacterized protein SERLADRAFT_480471 [Serpula lacrymans var. lacrymans S7.9]EGN93424.1 hypothetical protein SERLA73DRAFT_189609 [Serpula lacrymans var. lacrymans S7.3]EGO18802.1 hypothetical protein SERLADRAFT_480471 [Serpula lacrymans var. lacrymans S7.9]